MKNKITIIGFLIAQIILLNVIPGFSNEVLKSPDGQLTFELLELDKNEAGKAYSTFAEGKFFFYRVLNDNEIIVNNSPIGLTMNYTDFFNELSLESTGELVYSDESYRVLHGKSKEISSVYNQRDFNFSNADGNRLVLRVRLYNEGLAFKYILPDDYAKVRTVLFEATGYNIDPNGKAWLTPYSRPTKWKPSYEMYYTNGSGVGEPSPENPGWALPALFQVNSGKYWVMLHEAELTGNYPATHLGSDCQLGLYNIDFPHSGEALGLYSSLPKHIGVWEMPWRVVFISNNLSDIVESNIVYDLNAPAHLIDDFSWVKPGRASWEWWTTQVRERDYKLQLEFIDLAEQMGWEYYLVDANWNEMKGGTIDQLIEYANKKGVGVFLWYNSGGTHNHVAEQPRGRLWDERVRKEEFARLQAWGVKGIKVDFFNSDKQQIINQYIDILEDAAAFKLMVNFHGCTVPRGWSKTYPNLMSMEAIKGEETYGFDPTFPEMAPAYNTIAAFTRAVVGPADYTPVAFTKHNYPHLTSTAHELALPLIFQSGLLHFADSPSMYFKQPNFVLEYLKKLPVQFDEVKLLDGFPGEYAVVARRKADTWYVGIISGKEEVMDLTLDLSKLGKNLQIEVISDNQDGTVQLTTQNTDKNNCCHLQLLPYGGAVLLIQQK